MKTAFQIVGFTLDRNRAFCLLVFHDYNMRIPRAIGCSRPSTWSTQRVLTRVRRLTYPLSPKQRGLESNREDKACCPSLAHILLHERRGEAKHQDKANRP